MEKIRYKTDDIKSNLEFVKIIKYEKNAKEIFSFIGRRKLFN